MNNIELDKISDEVAKIILGTVSETSDNSELEFYLMNTENKVGRRTDPEHFEYALEKLMIGNEKETERLCDNIIYACAVAAAKYTEPIPYITVFWSEIFNGTRDILQINNSHNPKEAMPFATNIPEKVKRAIAGLCGLPVSKVTGEPYWEL